MIPPILAGSNGTILIPLQDPHTQASPLFSYGPYRDRHNFRIFAKLPDQEESEKLPCGFHLDRSSVQFDLQRIILLSPLPLGVTGSIYDISAPTGSAKFKKTELHKWTTKGHADFYPGLDLHLPLLNPGACITLRGVTRFTTAKNSYARNPFAMMTGGLTYPTMKQTIPVQISILAKLTWLPKNKSHSSIKVVTGDPLKSYIPATQPRSSMDSSTNAQSSSTAGEES